MMAHMQEHLVERMCHARTFFKKKERKESNLLNSHHCHPPDSSPTLLIPSIDVIVIIIHHEWEKSWREAKMMPVPKNYGAHHCIVGSALRRAALRLRYYPRRRLKEIAHPAGRSNTKPFNFFVGSSCLPKRPEDPKTNREKGGIRNKKGRKRHTHRQVFF